MNTEHALLKWLAAARKDSPELDIDADALTLHLMAISEQRIALEACRTQRASLALWGYSQASKAWLLSALYRDDAGRLPLVIGNKHLDYFTHINPGHHFSQMAIRFSDDNAAGNDSAYPLRLRLLREAQLAQIFIVHAAQASEDIMPKSQTFHERLTALQSLRQPHSSAALTSEDVASVALFWKNYLPARRQDIDDTAWSRFAELLPSLSVDSRARAWSLLWGDRPELTQQWQLLMQGLHLLGHNAYIHAPLSLLVDDFMLPAEGFLSPSSDGDSSVLVQLPGEQSISVSRSTLALLTCELILNAPHGALHDVDIIDIPASPTAPGCALDVSKRHWLLEGFRQRFQPDVLMVCNAIAQQHEIPMTARALTQWADSLHPQQDESMPGLVWAITPHDDRLIHKTQHDEAVQHLVGKPGQRWGTLHAFDKTSLQRLLEWLSRATQPALRTQRIDALFTQLHQKRRALLAPLLSENAFTRTQTETLIRALQARAAIHGELLEALLPPLERFHAFTDAHPLREARVNDPIHQDVDLFAAPNAPSIQEKTPHDAGTQAWRLWCQHLRHWSRQQTSARRLGLSPETLPQLVSLLIAISRDYGLAKQLRHAAIEQNAGAAELRTAIGNFIAWLGYADINKDERPTSRIAPGNAIFAAPASPPLPRLTQLDERPVHAASRYVYDWLVALYTRAGESQAGHDILSPEASLGLQAVLKKR